MARILIADMPEGIDRLTKVLVQEHDLLIARTMNEARKLVERWDDIDLVICGLQFDDSRMLDLLKEIKASQVSKHIPFVCFRQSASSLSNKMEHTTHLAAGLMGASASINASQVTGMTDEELLLLIDQQLEIDRAPRKRRQDALTDQTAQLPTSKRDKGYRILFLDNDPNHIQALIQAGGMGGHEVRPIRKIKEAMDFLNEQNHVDVIVSSAELGGSSVFQFIKGVKSDPRHNWVQFVLLSPGQSELADFMKRTIGGKDAPIGADKYVVMEEFDPIRLLKEIEAAMPEMPPQHKQDPIGDALQTPRSADEVPEDVTDAQHPKKKKPRG